MRATVLWLSLLSAFVAALSIAANGENASTVSKTTSAKLDGRTIICNMVQNSHYQEAIKSLQATLVATLEKKFEELAAALNKTAFHGQTFNSCKEIYPNHKTQENKAFFLEMDFGKVPVYCHMTNSGLGACGGGGWTLVMKINGTKSNFHYDSKLWSNKVNFNLPGGKTGLDHHETKLPTYWNTRFSKICLGMMIGNQMNFIVINKQANSLHSLIADGKYRATSLGRNTWKSLVGSEASLQSNCNKEGFNAVGDDYPHSKARIGVLGNQEGNCGSCDSRVGFGTGGKHDNSNTCGNEATHSPDNGDKHLKAMGYILVQ